MRDFRVLKGRGRKVANAAQMGMLPGLRYVLLTDYLIDHLDRDELDAVVAHELGHARQHHLLIKLAAVGLTWGVLEGIVVAIDAARHGHGLGGVAAAVLVAPLFVAIPVGMVLVQGLVGVRVETAADDVAAREVGAAQLASALEKVGRLNDTKRDTGRGWALLTQHPGLATRIEHLRDADRASARSGTRSPVPLQ